VQRHFVTPLNKLFVTSSFPTYEAIKILPTLEKNANKRY